MRLWLFHPLIFYPVVLGLALLAIGVSLKPQLMPRPAAAVAGQIDGPTVLLQRDAFNSPVDPPDPPLGPAVSLHATRRTSPATSTIPDARMTSYLQVQVRAARAPRAVAWEGAANF